MLKKIIILFKVQTKHKSLLYPKGTLLLSKNYVLLNKEKFTNYKLLFTSQSQDKTISSVIIVTLSPGLPKLTYT